MKTKESGTVSGTRVGVVIVLMIAIAGIAAWFFKPSSQTKNTEDSAVAKSANPTSYWTCPMHPQIHAEHSGECPICHMKLVQIASPGSRKSDDKKVESRSTVQLSEKQLGLLGIQRTEVEKMNLKIKIPVSGRFISSFGVAFQIYESDLRYIRPGVKFRGANAFYAEEEVEGVITSVDSIVDPTSRTVRAVGRVQSGGRGSLTETGFRGSIEIDLKNRIAIPESAVLHTGESDLVYLFTENDQLVPTVVKLGQKTEGFYDVLSGVEPGQTISSGPNFLVDSESKIRGASEPVDGSPAAAKPSCPSGEHWDTPMAMCMPGKG